MAKTTNYAHLTDKALYCMLRTEKWRIYDKDTRLELFQEVENRKAAQMGREPLAIVPFRAPRGKGNMMGYFSPDSPTELHINEKFLSGKNGLLYDFSVAAGLNCIIHEGRHAYQFAVAEGRIKDADEYQRKMWRMNLSNYYNGQGNMVMQTLYSQQEIERDARGYAERAIEEISEAIREETGKVDVGFEKAIYKLRSSEFLLSVLAEALLKEEALDTIDDVARARVAVLYPDEDVDGVSMFGELREMIRKREKLRKLDAPEGLKEFSGKDDDADDMDDIWKKLKERLKEADGEDKENIDAGSFREGGIKKLF